MSVSVAVSVAVETSISLKISEVRIMPGNRRAFRYETSQPRYPAN